MAAGSSAPELATAVIAVFIAKVSVTFKIDLQENRIICCQIFCDLLLKSAFEWIFNVMQLILVEIK
jgi:hypothetical protein